MREDVKLKLIAAKAKRDLKLKFSALVHHINETNLAQCYRELKRNKACGIDGVTVSEYGENLQENLKRLVEKLKTKQYWPQSV
jgi:RNA-directed DNA polymerase